MPAYSAVHSAGGGGLNGCIETNSPGANTGYGLISNGDGSCTWVALPGGGDAATASSLAQFAATTSAQLRGVLSDENGTGVALFNSGNYYQSSGYSTSYGTTNGTSTGALNAIMGTGANATWLLSGTTAGTFLYGIQGLDAGAVLRIYEGANYAQISNAGTASATAIVSAASFYGAGTGLTGTAASLNIGGTAANVTGTVAVANGGTGQTTAQNAINALTNVAAATNEYVLTKDTATGNALWKAATGGGGGVTAVGSIDTSPNANALYISGSTISTNLATAVYPGMMTSSDFTKLSEVPQINGTPATGDLVSYNAVSGQFDLVTNASGSAGKVLTWASGAAPTWSAAGAGDMILASAQTNTGVKTFNNSTIQLLGSSTGYTAFTSDNAGASNYVVHLPASTTYIPITSQVITFSGPSTARTWTGPDSNATLAALGTAQTWTAVQTITNSDLRLLGSSTGYTTFTSDNSGATNYTMHVPALDDTLVSKTSTDTLTNKTETNAKEIGPSYATVSGTSQGTGNINIDGASYSDYNYSNGASTATYTPVITSAPASGYVRYITLTVGCGSCAGVITMTWTNVSWIGTAGAATTTTNKSSTYACKIPSSGNALCSIVAEAY